MEPLGLGAYADKFKSWDHMLNCRSLVLKHKVGMNCRERKLLRRKANNWRLVQYYMTGIPYQYKYCLRKPPTNVKYQRDFSSEDETTFVIPTEEGLYRTYFRYPGSSTRVNHLYQTYEEYEQLHSLPALLGGENDLPDRPVSVDVDAAFDDVLGSFEEDMKRSEKDEEIEYLEEAE